MIPVPGPQAYVVLLFWPILVAILFQRLALAPALIWSIVGGYLILPAAWVVNIDLPVVPQLDKKFLPAISAVLMSALFYRQQLKMQGMNRGTRRSRIPIAHDVPSVVLPGWLPRSPVGVGLLLLLVAGTLMTTFANRDPVVVGPTVLRGMSLYDTVSELMNMAVFLLPVLLGRKFLSSTDSHKLLLKIMCFAAAGYCFLALYEVRMSPQLNNVVYGFFPHSWVQHIRGDGFRPLVFLDHGLLWGIFLCCAILGTAVLIRLSEGPEKVRYMIALLFMIVTLILSKTLGAMVICFALLPFALLSSPAWHLRIAMVASVFLLAFPAIRAGGLIDTDGLIEFVETNVNPARAESLQFRFHHEENMLEHVRDRPVLGWGMWGRWRIWDENGEDITVSDGEWIITFAEWGWVGYAARLGFFCFPLIWLAFRRRRHDIGLETSVLCLMMTATLIDFIPNAKPSPIIYLVVGAVIGRLELRKKAAGDEAATASDTTTEPLAPRFGAAPAGRRWGGQAGRSANAALAVSSAAQSPVDDGDDLSETITRHSRFGHTKSRKT